MKKRLLLLLLVTYLIVCLCACSRNEKNSVNTDSNLPTEAQGESTNDSPDNSEEPIENDPVLTAFEKLSRNGLIPAQDMNELWGYINTSGEWVISPIFADARSFWGSGLALVNDAQNHTWGLIDDSGNYAIEPTFTQIGNNLSDGLFRVDVPGRGWGYIDASGTFVIEPQFGGAYDFSNGLAKVKRNTVYGDWSWEYIDINGNPASPPDTTAPHNFVGLQYKWDPESGLIGYVNSSDNWVIPPQYITASTFLGGVAVAAVGSVEDALRGTGQQYLIDTEGNRLVDFGKNVSVTDWRNPERIAVIDNLSGKTGFWNLAGDIVIDYMFDETQGFVEDYSYATVKCDGLWGIIDKDGNWLVPAQFLSLG